LIGQILQLTALILVFCGLTVIYFFIAVYISVKKFGGSLEKRHIYVILGLAAIFFIISIILSILGSALSV
jgi:hypothetical protein